MKHKSVVWLRCWNFSSLKKTAHKQTVSSSAVVLNSVSTLYLKTMSKQKGKEEYLRISFSIWILLSYNLQFFMYSHLWSDSWGKIPPLCGCFALVQQSKSWEMNITNLCRGCLTACSPLLILQTTDVLHDKAGEREVWRECLCWQNSVLEPL